LLLSVETQIILRYIQRGFFDRIKSMETSAKPAPSQFSPIYS